MGTSTNKHPDSWNGPPALEPTETNELINLSLFGSSQTFVMCLSQASVWIRYSIICHECPSLTFYYYFTGLRVGSYIVSHFINLTLLRVMCFCKNTCLCTDNNYFQITCWSFLSGEHSTCQQSWLRSNYSGTLLHWVVDSSTDIAGERHVNAMYHQLYLNGITHINTNSISICYCQVSLMTHTFMCSHITQLSEWHMSYRHHCDRPYVKTH